MDAMEVCRIWADFMKEFPRRVRIWSQQPVHDLNSVWLMGLLPDT